MNQANLPLPLPHDGLTDSLAQSSNLLRRGLADSLLSKQTDVYPLGLRGHDGCWFVLSDDSLGFDSAWVTILKFGRSGEFIRKIAIRLADPIPEGCRSVSLVSVSSTRLLLKVIYKWSGEDELSSLLPPRLQTYNQKIDFIYVVTLSGKVVQILTDDWYHQGENPELRHAGASHQISRIQRYNIATLDDLIVEINHIDSEDVCKNHIRFYDDSVTRVGRERILDQPRNLLMIDASFPEVVSLTVDASRLWFARAGRPVVTIWAESFLEGTETAYQIDDAYSAPLSFLHVGEWLGQCTQGLLAWKDQVCLIFSIHTFGQGMPSLKESVSGVIVQEFICSSDLTLKRGRMFRIDGENGRVFLPEVLVGGLLYSLEWDSQEHSMSASSPEIIVHNFSGTLMDRIPLRIPE